MTPQIFSLLFVSVLLVNLGIQVWLALRQLSHVQRHRDAVPSAFEGKISLSAHQKSADYTRAKTLTGLVELIIGGMLLLAWTLGGGLQWLYEQWQVAGAADLWLGVGFILSAFVLFSILELPMSIYQTFRVEQRFGFNNTTVGLFLVDLVKQFFLMMALGGPLIIAALWLMENTGEYWWVFVWLLWTGFTLLLIWLYPVAIAPLFNRFTPLQDDSLKARITALLKRNHLNLNGIYVMDGSRRSGHGNAYFTGFGANKRIVFFDTLLEGLDGEEIEAVLAHEVGHFKRKHIIKQIFIQIVLSFVALATLGYLAQQDWFFHGLGMQQASTAAALLLFLLVAPLFTFFLKPIAAWVSRKHEFEADAFASSQTPADTLIRALVKLYKENASTLTPDPLFSAFHDSHPPAPVRVAHLSSLAATDANAGS